MTNRILSIFASFLILLSITVVPAVAAPSGLQIFENDFFITSDDEYVQGEFIVKFKPDIGKNKIAEINSKNGASIKRAGPHFMTVNVPQGRTVSQMVESYSRNPNVKYAEPNYIAYTHMVPDDYYYGLQWHLDIPASDEIFRYHGENGGGINIEPAWDIATGTDVIVAVIDTGVAYEDYDVYAQAPDLDNTNFVPGYDFVNNDNHPNDDVGHGTHVAGTIAQSTNNNGIGVAGVAFDCSIMPIKVLDSSGSGSYDDIADGVYFAADYGAQVISMSLGGTYDSIALKEALAYAHNMGVTIVCSAGNDGAGALPSYPAAYDDYCIAVGATRYDEKVSKYSTTGDYVDIAAPGGDNTRDQNRDGYPDGVLQQTFYGNYTNFNYYFYQGTSMAAPHVSGVAALLISNGITDPDNIREAMQSTAEDKGPDGWDRGYGHGIVDAYAALQWSAMPNEQPVADDQSVTTDEDTLVSIILNATDPENDPLTYSIVSLPLNGALTGTAPDVTYIPDANYNGVDSFTFKANDGTVDSNEATVSITVSAVNDAPTASDQSVTTPENTSVNITLAATDVDGDSLTYSIVDAPSNGTVTLSGNKTIYTPSENYNGADSFTFKANDGTVDSNEATVSITVTEAAAPVNTMHIASIDMSTTRTRSRGWYTYATASVKLVDAAGNPVEGANVSGEWSGLTTDSDSGTTGDNGQVALESDLVKSAAGTFTFTVDNVMLDGWTYNSSANFENSGSITV